MAFGQISLIREISLRILVDEMLEFRGRLLVQDLASVTIQKIAQARYVISYVHTSSIGHYPRHWCVLLVFCSKETEKHKGHNSGVGKDYTSLT